MSNKMMMCSAEATRAVLPYPSIISAINEMFTLGAKAKAKAPTRTHFKLEGGGMLLLMPASDTKYTALKVVTVHGENAKNVGKEGALPVVQGEVLLTDTATGRRLAIFEGAMLTARRTAALSLAGLTRLGRHPFPKPASKMLLIGNGAQGIEHASAFIQMGGISHLWVSSVDPPEIINKSIDSIKERVERDLKLFGEALPFMQERKKHGKHYFPTVKAIGVKETARIASEEADVIVTCTTSKKPVLPDKVQSHATIVCMGAYTPEMAEAPPALLHSCNVAVDAAAGAKKEAGDLINAKLDWSKVIDLSSCEASASQGLSEEQKRLIDKNKPFLFKTVGHATWDLAAAKVAWENTSKKKKSSL